MDLNKVPYKLLVICRFTAIWAIKTEEFFRFKKKRKKKMRVIFFLHQSVGYTHSIDYVLCLAETHDMAV